MATLARSSMTRIVLPAATNLPQSELREEIPLKDALAVSVIGRRVRDFGVEEARNSEDASEDMQQKMFNERLIQGAREGSYRKTVASISEGADVHFRTLRKQTPLMVAAASNTKGTQDTMRFLLDTLSDLEARDDMGWTPLLHACRNNQKESVTFLLERSASVKARASDGKTVTMLATMEGGDHLVVDLVSQQAALDKKDERGWSILFFACDGGRSELVKWLLKRSVSAKETSKDGMTTLMVTADAGHKKIGEMLIKRNASMNSENSTGFTALMLALRSQREDFADWLLEEGAEVTAKSSTTDEDAMDIAESLGMNLLRSKIAMKMRQIDEANAAATGEPV